MHERLGGALRRLTLDRPSDPDLLGQDDSEASLPKFCQHITGDFFNLGIALAQTVRPIG